MEEEIKKLIESAADEKNFRKTRENGLFLSDNQIEILNTSHIDWKSCISMNELIFKIEVVLDEEEDEILDILASQLAEQEYYQNTKK